MLVAIVACSKSPEVTTAPKPSPTSTTGAIARQPSLDDTAVEEAKHCFASVCAVQGDSWATQTVFGGVHEYKNPQFRVTRSNTPADKLNGYDYRGTVRVLALAKRRFGMTDDEFVRPNAHDHWQPWENGDGKPVAEFEIVQQNGSRRCTGLDEYTKPDPDKMPPPAR